MTSNDDDRETRRLLETLFADALEQSASERAAFLDAHCPAPLRAELDSLLAADEAAGNRFMDSPVRRTSGDAFGESAASDLSDDDWSGRSLGHYDLERLLGEGGMGVVYLAQQREPIRRPVALKLLKFGLQSRGVLARFESERQTLALMNHPNIATVHDAGSTSDGRPYFAMEWVPGPAITDYCDRHRMTIADRLQLFLQVCAAVHHAHQKGVIHRDLKPSNVLVAQVDGRATPKVIDFGIAKATRETTPAGSPATQVGTFIGTPEYMSPEQASGDTDDVDTRSDLYALGLLLYELLVGHLPFDRGRLRSGSLSDVQRIICEEESPRPSTRVAAIEPGDADAARQRGVSVDSLRRQLRGDLDWIVLKALAKDRSRRYSSVAAFAADLQAYRDDEPVAARAPSLRYRMTKFVRRHRAAVLSTVLVIASLISGLIATLVQYRNAQERYRQVVQLSDEPLVMQLTNAGKKLWPLRPGQREPLDSWLVKAHGLLDRLPAHRAALAALREHALPYSGEQRRLDRESHPYFAKYEHLKAAIPARKEELARARAVGFEHADELERALDDDKRYFQKIERAIANYRTWHFDNNEDQWRHDTLSALVANLEDFSNPDPHFGILASVEQRRAKLDEIERRSMTSPEAQAAWAEAITAIRESPKYASAAGGLEIAPQFGLVPLGPDPRSGYWEFWHVQSGDRPQRESGPDGLSHWVMEKGVGIVFVLVPGGPFDMGAQHVDPDATNYDEHANDREAPVTRIDLAPFFMSKYETTQDQWLRWTGDNPSYFGVATQASSRRKFSIDEIVTCPVDSVSFHDVSSVAVILDVAVPTEAQWEYGARAGSATKWYYGSDLTQLGDYGNVADHYCHERHPNWRLSFVEEIDDGFGERAPVGCFAPNAFGLHDTIGNVEEWCRDPDGEYTNPAQPADGYRSLGRFDRRVTRGGNWAGHAEDARSTARSGLGAGDTETALGVRFSRPLDR